jgi:hypothetical protein
VPGGAEQPGRHVRLALGERDGGQPVQAVRAAFLVEQADVQVGRRGQVRPGGADVAGREGVEAEQIPQLGPQVVVPTWSPRAGPTPTSPRSW